MMGGYGSYQLWQVERSKTDAERRQANAALGALVVDVSRFFRGVTAPMRSLRWHRVTSPGRAMVSLQWADRPR